MNQPPRSHVMTLLRIHEAGIIHHHHDRMEASTEGGQVVKGRGGQDQGAETTLSQMTESQSKCRNSSFSV